MAAPYSDPLAYFLTWTTYGTWLPGDERGSTARGGAAIAPDERRRDLALRILREDPCLLIPAQRDAVEAVIRRHCEIRGWTPHAIAVRTNHVHVVVTAPGVHPEKARTELKTWGTRALKNSDATGRERWWADGGDICYINDDAALEQTRDYVLNRQ